MQQPLNPLSQIEESRVLHQAHSNPLPATSKREDKKGEKRKLHNEQRVQPLLHPIASHPHPTKVKQQKRDSRLLLLLKEMTALGLAQPTQKLAGNGL